MSNNYDHTFAATLPAGLTLIAKSIARAMDPDTGGYDSWITSDDGLTISLSTPCVAAFYEQAQYLMLHPEALHAAVCADYATRWPDLTPPTLEDCQAFCAQITVAA